jgi:hypothetical protein
VLGDTAPRLPEAGRGAVPERPNEAVSEGLIRLRRIECPKSLPFRSTNRGAATGASFREARWLP